MNDEKINCALPQVFRQIKVPEDAKEELRRRLFDGNRLSEDDLLLVSAAGDPTQNRYNPNTCPKDKANQSCWGFLGAIWCDHYRYEKNHDDSSFDMDVYDCYCAMRCFPSYKERKPCNPSLL